MASPRFDTIMPGKTVGLLLAAVLFTGLSHSALAQSYGPCADPQTTTDAIACLGKAGTEARARLEERRSRIRNILKKYNPPPNTHFDASEARWEEYVKITCDDLFNKLYEGGTIRLPNSMACELDATETHYTFLGRLFGFQLRQHQRD